MQLSVKEEEVDPRLADIVERMFRNTYDEGEYKQAVGIALEARRLERVEEVSACWQGLHHTRAHP